VATSRGKQDGIDLKLCKHQAKPGYCHFAECNPLYGHSTPKKNVDAAASGLIAKHDTQHRYVIAADASLNVIEALVAYFMAQFKIKPHRILIFPDKAYGFCVKYISYGTLDPDTVTMLTSRADGFIAGWKARDR